MICLKCAPIVIQTGRKIKMKDKNNYWTKDAQLTMRIKVSQKKAAQLAAEHYGVSLSGFISAAIDKALLDYNSLVERGKI